MCIRDRIERIHKAGGIAIATHPFAIGKMGVGKRAPSTFNAIEVVNSASLPFLLSTRMNRKLAVRLGLPQTAGSDAHIATEIGHAYTLVDADNSVDDIVEAISKGKAIPTGKPIPWRMRLQREALSLKKKGVGV